MAERRKEEERMDMLSEHRRALDSQNFDVRARRLIRMTLKNPDPNYDDEITDKNAIITERSRMRNMTEELARGYTTDALCKGKDTGHQLACLKESEEHLAVQMPMHIENARLYKAEQIRLLAKKKRQAKKLKESNNDSAV
jgi:hypothetical protein